MELDVSMKATFLIWLRCICLVALRQFRSKLLAARLLV